jgi:hypothetical protein
MFTQKKHCTSCSSAEKDLTIAILKAPSEGSIGKTILFGMSAWLLFEVPVRKSLRAALARVGWKHRLISTGFLANSAVSTQFHTINFSSPILSLQHLHHSTAQPSIYIRYTYASLLDHSHVRAVLIFTASQTRGTTL